MSESRPEDRRDGRAWVGIAGAALVAALLIPSGPPGIGFFLTGIAITVAVVAARPRPPDLEAAGFAAAALLFLAMATFLDAEWVVAVDVLAAAGCSAVAVTSARTWASILSAPFRVMRETVRVPPAVVASIPRSGRRLDPGAAARAFGLSALLLLTFGALFTSADAAFARLAGDVLLPDVAPELLPARILVGVIVVAGAGGLVLAGRNRAEMLSPSFDDVWNRPAKRPIATIEWALPLALLDALFAAFVLVQVAVLFGGHEHVLETTGLTYAQYAREGFFQLTWIAVLVLGVIAVSVRVLRDSPRQQLLRALLGTLCALTLVVLVSALRRMDLYEAAYGLTRVRVSVYAALLWMGGVFVLVMVAGATRRATWLPRTVLAFTVAALLAFNVSNPDARIAQAGVERWRSTGGLDESYLATLSADAVPALMELPLPELRCIVGLIGDRTRRASGAWSSFNLSRARALDLTGTEASGCPYLRSY